MTKLYVNPNIKKGKTKRFMGIFQSIWEDAFMKEFTWERILQFLIRMA